MSSAYGSVAKPAMDNVDPAKLAAVLKTLRFHPPSRPDSVLAIVPVPCARPLSPTLLAYLQSLLNHEIRAGNTYPQEFEVDAAGFSAYFLSADAFLAILWSESQALPTSDTITTWTADQCAAHIAGMFYVKQNYPGRSSHICNGGFITAPQFRIGLGVGRAMALSFLRVAPLLGYRASVFNLVYTSNEASVRLWSAFGFKEIGRVPQAGRLRTKDGKEEFTDAIVFYFDFLNWAAPALELYNKPRGPVAKL
ncbi:hypothetical protein GGF31_006119 [Allomyces arbusculus]|nr:hypothetical protein GGF31_006119 [Allomyces arbusculus]